MSEASDEKAASLTQIEVLRQAMAQREALLLQAFSLCRHWHLAEDVVQEAVLVAAERWQDVRDQAGIMPWMRRIVHLKSLELLRREQRAGQLPLDESVLEAISDALASGASEHGAGSVNAVGEHLNQLKAALHHCMAGLRSDHKQLLDAFYWQQRSCEDLAAEFQRRPDNLRAILSRLRKRLMHCVEQRIAGLANGSSALPAKQATD